MGRSPHFFRRRISPAGTLRRVGVVVNLRDIVISVHYSQRRRPLMSDTIVRERLVGARVRI